MFAVMCRSLSQLWNAQAATQANACFEEAMSTLQDAYKVSDDSTLEGVKKGIRLLKEAVEHDSEHGLAHGQLALSLMNSVSLQTVRARHSATDTSLALPSGVLQGEGTPEEAIVHFQEGLRLSAVDDWGRPLLQMVYGDALFLTGMLEEAADTYLDCLELPTVQENDKPRIYLRSYLINVAMARTQEARAAFENLSHPMFEPMEALVEQLEKVTPEDRENPEIKEELAMIRTQSIDSFSKMFRNI